MSNQAMAKGAARAPAVGTGEGAARRPPVLAVASPGRGLFADAPPALSLSDVGADAAVVQRAAINGEHEVDTADGKVKFSLTGSSTVTGGLNETDDGSNTTVESNGIDWDLTAKAKGAGKALARVNGYTVGIIQNWMGINGLRAVYEGDPGKAYRVAGDPGAFPYVDDDPMPWYDPDSMVTFDTSTQSGDDEAEITKQIEDSDAPEYPWPNTITNPVGNVDFDYDSMEGTDTFSWWGMVTPDASGLNGAVLGKAGWKVDWSGAGASETAAGADQPVKRSGTTANDAADSVADQDVFP